MHKWLTKTVQPPDVRGLVGEIRRWLSRLSKLCPLPRSSTNICSIQQQKCDKKKAANVIKSQKHQKNAKTNIVRFETSTSPSWKDIKMFIRKNF